MFNTAEVGRTSMPARFPSRVTNVSANPRPTPDSSVPLPKCISGRTAKDERPLQPPALPPPRRRNKAPRPLDCGWHAPILQIGPIKRYPFPTIFIKKLELKRSSQKVVRFFFMFLLLLGLVSKKRTELNNFMT